eukprot:1100375-Pleurochrysis_carterae.AAC.1
MTPRAACTVASTPAQLASRLSLRSWRTLPRVCRNHFLRLAQPALKPTLSDYRTLTTVTLRPIPGD